MQRNRNPRRRRAPQTHMNEDRTEADYNPCAHNSTDDSWRSGHGPALLERFGRRFRGEDEYPDRFTLEDIEVPQDDEVFMACPGSKRKCVTHNVHQAHKDCQIVAIDGACSNNGKEGARASIGVYHGRGSMFNSAYPLDSQDRHTSQVAELRACLTALSNAIIIKAQYESRRERFGRLVIKSDSEYIVHGVTEWLPKWKSNGWKNARGLPVANRREFEQIERLVEQLEEKVLVQFWWVPRKNNQLADSLAKLSLK